MFEHVQAGAEHLLASFLADHHACQQQAAQALRKDAPGQLRIADDLGPGLLQLHDLLLGTLPHAVVGARNFSAQCGQCAASVWLLDMRLTLHLILGGIISFFLGVMIFLITAMDRPLQGEVSVSSDAYKLMYDHVMQWDES